MATVLPELKFRHYLEPKMRDHWMMTWHEDREITPGVPDLHYVMKNPEGDMRKYFVGWLELKSIDSQINSRHKISVEASQHQYIRRWLPYMPIHFLVRIVDRVFVIPGKYHRELADARCAADISVISAHQFHQSLIPEELPQYLREQTVI